LDCLTLEDGIDNFPKTPVKFYAAYNPTIRADLLQYLTYIVASVSTNMATRYQEPDDYYNKKTFRLVPVHVYSLSYSVAFIYVEMQMKGL